MRFVNGFSTSSGDQLVYFRQQPLEVFGRYIQQGEKAREAGGIMLGYVRGEHLEVVEVTEPTILDRRFKFFFERMPYLHKRRAAKRWQESGGLIRYIGEWHTHPQDIPIPSHVDLKEWQILAADRYDGRPLLAVIVGCLELHVEYMYASGQRCILNKM